jgi:hypothetical protein
VRAQVIQGRCATGWKRPSCRAAWCMLDACLPREATGKITAQSLRELARSLLGCADA